MKTKLYASLAVSALALGLVMPVTSHAFLITSGTVDDTFEVTYLLEAGEVDGNDNENKTGQDLWATVLFTHTAWDGDNNTLSLTLDVKNLSEDDENNDVGLWALAFGMDPTATDVAFSHIDGDEKFLAAALTIDQQLQNAVFDLTTGAQTNTDPGYPKTLQEGESQRFQLHFTFSSNIDDGVTFSPFSSGWQTGNGSYQFAGTENGFENGQIIPEPATLGLLGIGLFGLGMASYRRRRLASTEV